jgi:hypothetical protein
VSVSLASLTVISHEQFTEFLPGLVTNSPSGIGNPFIWLSVLRPESGQEQDAAL